ncbi:S8 family serine peptidase [bacterium]|nr:S8 family serine peptidase [bacterium]
MQKVISAIALFTAIITHTALAQDIQKFKYFLKFQNEFNELAGEPSTENENYTTTINEICADYNIIGTRFPFARLNTDVKFVVELEFSEALSATDLETINALDLVDYMEEVPLDEFFFTPNDLNSKQWYLKNIEAEDAWAKSRGSKDIVIAIVDNAFLLTHEDLKDAYWHNSGETPGNGKDDDGNGYIDDVDGWDVADGDNDPSPPKSSISSFVHGTHVAGIAGASTNNNKGVASVAFKVSIMPIKASASSGGGGYVQNGFDGVTYAILNGANVINMSWGSPKYSKTYDAIIQNAHKNGVVCVAAAGNSSTDVPLYPAAYDHVISVGATTKQDEITSFSNYGKTVTVMAPGDDIYSCVPNSNSSYDYLSGTSMASPMVASLVALIMSEAPGISESDLLDILQKTCKPVKNLPSKLKNGVGFGIINAKSAINEVTKLTAVYYADHEQVCPGDYVTYFNISRGKVKTAKWRFQGGNPKSATGNFPKVYYGSAGKYKVTLIVTDSTGTDSTSGYVVVAKPTAKLSGGGNFYAGSTVLMKLECTGAGPWEVTYSDGTNTKKIKVPENMNTYYFTEQPGDTITYTITSVKDANCYGDVTGTATFYKILAKKVCISIQPGPNQAKDAMINSNHPTTSLYKIKDYAAWVYLIPKDGAYSTGRGFLEFDLSTIPKDAEIKSAKLSLFYSSTSSNAGQTGENASVLRRITQSWADTTINWNNQPKTSRLNEVYLAKSTKSNQDYPDIDITKMIKDMIAYPDSSFGISIKNRDETKKNRSMKFFSSNGEYSTKWPKLDICYTLKISSSGKPVCSPPVANFTFDNQCSADSIKFTNESKDTSGSNLVYSLWSFGDGETTLGDGTVKHLYKKKGTYNVKLVVFNDNGAGCSDTIIKSIKIDNKPFIGGPDSFSICKYDSLSTDFLSMSCVAKPYTISWNNSSWVANPLAFHTKISPPYSTKMTVTLKDNFGNVETKSIYIKVDNNCCQSHSQFDVNDEILCIKDKLKISNKSVSSKGTATYLWSFGKYASTQNYSGTNPPDISFKQSGVMPVKLFLIDDCGVDSITQNIAVFNNPDFYLPADTAYCSAYDSVTVSVKAIGSYEYAWKPATQFSNPRLASPKVYLKDTSTVGVTVTDHAIGCSTTKHILLKRNTTTLSVNLGTDTIICIGKKMQLGVNEKNAHYEWNTGDTTQNIDITKGGEYSVKVMNQCAVGSDTIKVSESDVPTIEITGDTILCDSNYIVLHAKGSHLDYVSWDNKMQGKYHKADHAGIYKVYTVNICGTATAEHKVDTCDGVFISEVVDENDVYAYIPSAFSPNNDGINDIFRFSVSQHETFRIDIYNSLGVAVYSSTNPNEGWNGYFNGDIVSMGKYFFKMTMLPKYGMEPVSLNGTLTVIR